MRMVERACVRAGIRVRHSQGYNPHPRMSLVLPRSVGVESDDELLCLWLEEGETEFDACALKKEMPEGIEIVSAEISGATRVPEASLARYVINVPKAGISEYFKGRIGELLASDEIVVDRFADGARTKKVNVRPFLGSIRVEGDEVIVECRISSAGTIRIDEILELLKLSIEDLAGPVRRTMVEWKGL